MPKFLKKETASSFRKTIENAMHELRDNANPFVKKEVTEPTRIVEDGNLTGESENCPQCGGKFYYNGHICYTCYGTGVTARKQPEKK